jgi:hypothetical protein
MRRLDVFIDHRRVGVLHEGDDLWRFEYDAQWAVAAEYGNSRNLKLLPRKRCKSVIRMGRGILK